MALSRVVLEVSGAVVRSQVVHMVVAVVQVVPVTSAGLAFATAAQVDPGRTDLGRRPQTAIRPRLLLP
ncbi:MAG: hypothetical protein WCI29_08165, partial [Actinomycetes bacterium]